MGATSTDPTENNLATTSNGNSMNLEDNDQPMAEHNVAAVQNDNDNHNDDDVVDETPAFVSAEDAVEVQVDDDVAMDDEDEDDDDNVEATNIDGTTENNTNAAATVVDMSQVQLTSHTGPVYAVRAYIHPDNNNKNVSIVTGGGDDKAFVHRVNVTAEAADKNADTQPLSHPHTDSVSAVAWNLPYWKAPSDGQPNNDKKNPRLVAVGAYDGAIALYNADSHQLVRALEGPTDVECLVWHPKGGTVLLAGSAADGTLWMYHTPLDKVLQVFVGHESSVVACDFTADGKYAVSASADGTVRVWAPRTGQCRHVFRFQNDDNDAAAGLTCLAVGGGTDTQLLLVGAEDGQAHVCHVGTQKVVARLAHATVDETKQTSAGNDNDNEDDDDEDMQAAAVSVEAVGFSPSHPQWCATAGVDGVLKIWDLSSSSTPHCRQVCRLPEGGVTRLSWHPTLPLVFTSSTAGTVHLWDARNGQQLCILTGHATHVPLNDMDVQFRESDGHALVVSGSDDHTVRVFDVNVPALWNQQS